MARWHLPPIARFMAAAVAWLIALTVVWSQVSAWTSYPVAWLTHVALEQGAPMWVRKVHVRPGVIEAETTIEIAVPQAGGRKAEFSVEASPARYAYGLPILLALLLAAGWRRRGLWQRALAGYVLLWPTQALSTVMFLLMQMISTAQFNLRTLRADMWQLEAIIYGYQAGALVLPTLVPVMLWLWLDRAYVAEVLVPGFRRFAGQSAVPR
ncbi:hypothetical protein GCM10023090_20440 [Acidovorax lacteus]|uniref:Uncharacterized protein n=2 Tax=Acidovorax lacteus TaxID=1924988 RepID=A0ABP8LAK3_9BURK